MLAALIQMGLLIACGTFWAHFAPAHIPVMAHRRAITDIVFVILLPALVLDIIWQTPLGTSSIKIAVVAAGGIVIGLCLMWGVTRWLVLRKETTGALLLAAAFPNSTYLGLPVLSQAIGPESRAVVLQYDLFACTPILLTGGIMLAQRFSMIKNTAIHPLKGVLRVPPLWAVVAGVALNVSEIAQPEILHKSLSLLAGAVVPLMLIVLGMSIRWRSLHLRYFPRLLPVVLISLLLVPLGVNWLGGMMELGSSLRVMTSLIAAMPTMVFGIVICERYHLDVDIYAAAVTLTTLSALVTLPFWHYVLVDASLAHG